MRKGLSAPSRIIDVVVRLKRSESGNSRKGEAPDLLLRGTAPSQSVLGIFLAGAPRR